MIAIAFLGAAQDPRIRPIVMIGRCIFHRLITASIEGLCAGMKPLDISGDVIRHRLFFFSKA